MSRLICCMTLLAVLVISHRAGAADQNQFASIFLDEKKIGQIHYALRTDEKGMVEEIKTRSSVSILGFQVYYFTQDLHEVWKTGELQSLQADTDDHRKIYKSSLKRNAKEYDGVLNGKPLTLPQNAFPTSVWHYDITQQSLLFDLKDFRPMKVAVSKSEDSLSVAGRSIPTSRFNFSGEWQASIWFDQNKQLVKMNYKAEGRDIVITMDPK
ncbi:MAG: DUF6134 family protein [Candidatus Binatia bacterium]